MIGRSSTPFKLEAGLGPSDLPASSDHRGRLLPLDVGFQQRFLFSDRKLLRTPSAVYGVRRAQDTQRPENSSRRTLITIVSHNLAGDECPAEEEPDDEHPGFKLGGKQQDA